MTGEGNGAGIGGIGRINEYHRSLLLAYRSDGNASR